MIAPQTATGSPTPLAGSLGDAVGSRGAATGDSAPRCGGQPLHQRLLTDLPLLVPAVLTRLLDQLPAYAAMPPEQVRGEITRATEHGIRHFVEVLRTGELPGRELLEKISESSAQRADEGIPLEAVVGAYHLGAEECATRILATAEPGDLPDVLRAQHRLLGYLRLVSCAVATGYVRERQAALGEEQVARQALLSRLLEGGSPQAAADRAGLPLPPSYLVLSIAAGPHPDELLPGVNRSVAARRKVRRLRHELERQSRGVPLTALSEEGGLALLPQETPVAGLGDADWVRLGALVEQLGRICGAELLVAAAAAAPDGVAEAARLVGEVRQVARAAGLGTGLYRLDDVLLEYQLSRPGPARDGLAALLAPLAGRPELLETLRAFQAAGFDRRQAATRLRVHPNTVDYRLRKATALTGLDPARSGDLPMLRAALAAFDAAARERPTSG
ncbi:PucR-like helix-turn-helix protein [Streptomyces sp. 1114.5]|uniref:PucR family transcriptional regulator n=1 Tax=Streptomyces sp. 1114.5 TaxID=1938830 RepID=UPI000F1ADD77|nr:helix-turn-helix domain-containing protein [Streptomyces sp. 1114.5]RKT11370.1 PucR-like helix-turn-helix protein [Streptomyces sp. 1114.5]